MRTLTVNELGVVAGGHYEDGEQTYQYINGGPFVIGADDDGYRHDGYSGGQSGGGNASSSSPGIGNPNACGNGVLAAGGFGMGIGSLLGGLVGAGVTAGNPAGIAFGAALGGSLGAGGAGAAAMGGSACQAKGQGR